MLSKKITKLDQDNITVKVGEEVDLVIGESSDLGYSVVINNIHEGLLYHGEVFQTLLEGQTVKGFIKKVREDNKIDVTLQRFGYRKVEPNAEKILQRIKDNKGVLHLTDKSAPQDITAELQMSKKVFKKAIGALYKQKMIRIEDDGIYLNPANL